MAMKVLMAASEMAPYVQTGGLSEVMQALPVKLTERGHEVSVVLPGYRQLLEQSTLEMKPTGVEIPIQVGAKRVIAAIYEARTKLGIQVFAVRRDEYFDRSSVYGDENRAYDDNAERFLFFSKAVVELARRMDPAPDLVHVHDWACAMIPVFIKESRLRFASMLTIHNIAYQGSFWGLDFNLTNLPPHWFGPRGVEFYGRLNFLKGGILSADLVSTVSEQYAREIQMPEFAFGLEHVMREHAGKLIGILNGADDKEWNPAKDRFLTKKFDAKNFGGKTFARNRLLREAGLKKSPTGPVISMISRVVSQKGFDLLLPIADRLLTRDVRLVILGEGDPALEADLQLLAKRYPEKVAYIRDYTPKLAHVINAGADVTLVPSRFEPCGLSAIYALKYGTLPVVRGVGGLQQIVEPYEGTGSGGYGFLFYDYHPEALWDAILRALECYAEPTIWHELIQRAMARDFSWDDSILHYEAAYKWAIKNASNR